MSDSTAPRELKRSNGTASMTREKRHDEPSDACDWNFSSGIKLFYIGVQEPAPLTATGFVPMPSDKALPGYLCQAARGLLDVSQAWLSQHAGVSRKTINDFENGYASPKIALNLRIRRSLEQAGAQFVHGEGVVGVVVYISNAGAKHPGAPNIPHGS